MKKFFQLSLALLSVISFSACSSDTAVSKRAEGKYLVERETNMVGLPPVIPFTPIEENVQLVVKAEADYFVKITLPATDYNFQGQEMQIPEFTISGVAVVDDTEGGASILSHSFNIEGTKNITGTISGEFDDDGDVDLIVQYTCGNMPFPIKQEFETLD